MNIYSFPTIMLNKKDVLQFFKSFEVKVLNNEEDKENEEKKDFYKAIGIVIGIIFIILIVVSIILYAFNK